MKFEIYTPDMPEPDQLVRLALREEDSGFSVVAVDKDGEIVDAGYLIYFNDNGTITRESSVNPDLGFKLDKEGCIMEDE